MYLLLGMGKVGNSIKNYFDKVNNTNQKKIKYLTYDDKNDQNTFNMELINDIDVIIKSPGIRNDHKIIIEALKLKKNIFIYTELELFQRFHTKKNKIIAITGTNGKSTVCTLLNYIIDNSLCVGNIGKPLFDYIDDDRTLIIECSSFMGEYCFTNTFAPDISCLLNIYPNHLDHHGSIEKYMKSKEKIIWKTKKAFCYNYDDLMNFCLINRIKRENRNNSKNIDYYSYSIKDDISDVYIKNHNIYFQKEKLFKVKELNNYFQNYVENVLACICLIKANGYEISNQELLNKINEYIPLEHRFEEIESNKLLNNLTIYNDSKSTNFYAIKKALEGLGKKKVLLICGGKLRESDNYLLIDGFDLRILSFGENRYMIRDALRNYDVYTFETLRLLIKNLSKYLYECDVILFSPGSVSLDQYKSFEERGKEFKMLIKQYYFDC